MDRITTQIEDDREQRGAMCLTCGHRVKWHHDTEGCDFHGRGPHRCSCDLDSDQVVVALIEHSLTGVVRKDQPVLVEDCVRATHYKCMCGGTKGCGCRLTDPPTHFHQDGRYLGHTCPQED